MEKHSGIRIDKIPVESWGGLIFVAGILAISFVGIQPLDGSCLLAS
jgi:hypothetical protein